MSIINVVAVINDNDAFKIDDAYINYNIENNDIFTYTFWNNNFEKLPQFFLAAGLDLFYISLAVFGVDRILSRDSTTDSWTRNIKLFLPVIEVEKWEKNKHLLEEILTFLSGDIWLVEFRERELTELEKKIKNKVENSTREKIDINKICMFSGGLDSFIGSIDLMEQDKSNDIFFVSHYGGGKGVIEYQKVLIQSMISQFCLDEDNFWSFYAAAKNGIENTTRTRSFMFFCHAIILGTAMNKKIKLIIPENGLISLNIPLTNSRLGSSSTRTTHPYYLEMLQKLIINLGIDLELENPYQFKTKGEMIIECKNSRFLKENIKNTMSCSHPDEGRMKGNKETSHCGNCLPCVIRRASILKADIEDTSIYRDLNFTSGPTAKTNLMSYEIGIAKFNAKYSFLRIQNSGPINMRIEDYVGVYDKGMEELADFLEGFNEEILS